MKMVAVYSRHAAMAVAHVFAKTNVRDHHHIGTLSFNRADRFLHNAVFGISGARSFVLLSWYAEKQHTLQTKRMRAFYFLGDFCRRQLKNPGHARDLPPAFQFFADKKRQDKIMRT